MENSLSPRADVAVLHQQLQLLHVPLEAEGSFGGGGGRSGRGRGSGGGRGWNGVAVVVAIVVAIIAVAILVVRAVGAASESICLCLVPVCLLVEWLCVACPRFGLGVRHGVGAGFGWADARLGIWGIRKSTSS